MAPHQLRHISPQGVPRADQAIGGALGQGLRDGGARDAENPPGRRSEAAKQKDPPLRWGGVYNEKDRSATGFWGMPYGGEMKMMS